MNWKSLFAGTVLAGLFSLTGPSTLTAWGQGAPVAQDQPSPPLPTPPPPPPAVTPAQTNRDAKLAELEKRIQELEIEKKSPTPPKSESVLIAQDGKDATIPNPPTAPVPADQTPTNPMISPTMPDFGQSPRLTTPPFANMPDGFTYRSPNGQHEIRFTGQIQFDERVYNDRGETAVTDEFLLRRARIGIEGTLFSNCEFRILPDFGQGKVVMQDAFANLHYFDSFQVEAGKFKEPVSYEEAYVQDRFVPTVERSIIDQITPARDIGVLIHGENLLNKQLDYAVGVFNGEINGDADTNKLKDWAGRVAWRPFYYDCLPDLFHMFQIGISGTVGREQEALSLTGVGNETLRTSSQIPWLVFVAKAQANGNRDRVVPEVSYFYGPFGCVAEYIRMDQAISSGAAKSLPQNVRFDGYMMTATLLLTGESRTNGWTLLYPLNDFDPRHPISNPGAWELVGSVSHLGVDSAIFRPGAAYQLANPVGQSDGAVEVTTGFNWYLNAFVRVQFNWERAYYAQPVNLGAANRKFDSTDALMTRLQLIW